MRKNTIQEIVDSLPDDAEVDVEAFMEKIDLPEKLEEAERHFTPGMEIPQEEIEKEFKAWLK